MESLAGANTFHDGGADYDDLTFIQPKYTALHKEGYMAEDMMPEHTA